MLQLIHASGDDAAGSVRKVKSKDSGVRLMGSSSVSGATTTRVRRS
jgi:hypothetical protein